MRMRSMPPPRLAPRNPLRAAALAALLIGANSGGIVGFCGCVAALGRGAALGLRLAPLEILPQGRAQAPLPPGLVHALGRLGFHVVGPSVHGPRLRLPGSASKGSDIACVGRACASCALVARIAALFRPTHILLFRLRPGAAVAQW